MAPASPAPDADLPSAAEIDLLMGRFYAEIRKHPQLGPVFNDTVGDAPGAWERHEAKIASFWRQALGIERRGYTGNPMMTHAANPAVMPKHFPVWIGLFERCAGECLRPEAAARIVKLAKRIGDGLAMGLSHARGRQGPPALRPEG